MRPFFRVFRNLRPVLYFLLVISLITYFTISLWLINIPEAFQGAYEIGQFVLKISISYVSAFLFYFIVVHLKNERDKDNIREFVGITVHQIIDNGKNFVIPLLKINNPKKSFEYPKKKGELEEVMNINPFLRQAPIRRGNEHLNWIEYYDYLIDNSENLIDKILHRNVFLDTELIKILTRMEQSLLFRDFELMLKMMNLKPKNQKLNLLTMHIESYIKHIETLEKYANRHFKDKQVSHQFLGWE